MLDDLIFVNLSLWTSLPDLSAYVYKSQRLSGYNYARINYTTSQEEGTHDRSDS